MSTIIGNVRQPKQNDISIFLEMENGEQVIVQQNEQVLVGRVVFGQNTIQKTSGLVQKRDLYIGVIGVFKPFLNIVVHGKSRDCPNPSQLLGKKLEVVRVYATVQLQAGCFCFMIYQLGRHNGKISIGHHYRDFFPKGSIEEMVERPDILQEYGNTFLVAELIESVFFIKQAAAFEGVENRYC